HPSDGCGDKRTPETFTKLLEDYSVIQAGDYYLVEERQDKLHSFQHWWCGVYMLLQMSVRTNRIQRLLQRHSRFLAIQPMIHASGYQSGAAGFAQLHAVLKRHEIIE